MFKQTIKTTVDLDKITEVTEILVKYGIGVDEAPIIIQSIGYAFANEELGDLAFGETDIPVFISQTLEEEDVKRVLKALDINGICSEDIKPCACELGKILFEVDMTEYLKDCEY